jgi:hypothetical protein
MIDATKTLPNKSALLILALLVSGGPAKADITYTWQNDLGYSLSGAMTVQNAAQTAGAITPADITSFTFDIPAGYFPQAVPALTFSAVSSLYSPFNPNLPISTLTAAPTNISSYFTAYTSAYSPISGQVDSFELLVTLDTNWASTRQESWDVFDLTQGYEPVLGLGHWTIAGASVPSVPEPSTAVISVFGALSGIAYGVVRKRREQRREGRGAQPQPI